MGRTLLKAQPKHKDGLGNPASHKTLFSSQSHHLRSLFLRMMCRANRAEKLYEKDIILILFRYICVIQGLYYLQLLFLRRSFVEMRNNYISSLLLCTCSVLCIYVFVFEQYLLLTGGKENGRWSRLK